MFGFYLNSRLIGISDDSGVELICGVCAAHRTDFPRNDGAVAQILLIAGSSFRA
jgi:hypothetical protein